MPQVAFYTFGLLHEPLGHPRVEGFVSLSAPVFERARSAPGFVWLVETEEAVFPRFKAASDHAADTLSVWATLEAVHAFAYGGLHAEALRQRKSWFRNLKLPTYVAWWVPEGHIPTWAEAVARYEALTEHGPTPFAFDFRTAFGPDGKRAALERKRLSHDAS